MKNMFGQNLQQIEVNTGCNYPEDLFIENWSTCRTSALNKPTFIKRLTNHERSEFNKVKQDYTKDEINKAMVCLFQQETIPMDVMVLRPKHFLEHFDTYYSAGTCKTIYGSKKKTY